MQELDEEKKKTKRCENQDIKERSKRWKKKRRKKEEKRARMEVKARMRARH